MKTPMQKKSYMVLKVPVGYSLLKNAKAIIEHKTGTKVDDEDLEEIFARFLDLVVFGLMKDTENVGSAMPSADAFVEVADEVLTNSDKYDDELDFDDEDEDEELRFDEDEGDERY